MRLIRGVVNNLGAWPQILHAIVLALPPSIPGNATEDTCGEKRSEEKKLSVQEEREEKVQRTNSEAQGKTWLFIHPHANTHGVSQLLVGFIAA